jgi:hypothetical protein
MNSEGRTMQKILIAALVIPVLSLAAYADEAAIDADIVADQVRSQGFACADPVSAQRDAEKSKPDEAFYVLTCADATYNVMLVPDMAAQVTPAQ